MGSTKYTFNREDLKKIAKGAGVAAAGAALTYAGPMLLGMDYTVTVSGKALDLTPVVVATLSVAVNIARKWLTDHSDQSKKSEEVADAT